MIVTKQRKSFHSMNPQLIVEKNISSSPHQQHLSRNYRPSAQTVYFNYNNRERHSISHISSIQKNNQNRMNFQDKKSQKKYDYSVSFQKQVDKQHLNKTHARIHDTSQYTVKQKPEQNNVTFLLDRYERRRYSSTKENTPKYKYSASRQMINGELSEVLRSCNKLSNNQQKIEVKEYLKAYEPKYQSSQKITNKNFIPSQNKENANIKAFFTQNKLEDNFTATDKFLQFKTQKKIGNNQQTINKGKYEPQYSRMRNNKKYQIVNQEQQRISIEKNNCSNQESKLQIDQTQLNFQNLLKSSLVQNGKIHQKIFRISKLNEQINLRLNKMLHRQKVT